MKVIIDPSWTLVEVVEAAWTAYTGSGIQSTIYKVMIIKAWSNVVGRRRAVSQLQSLVVEYGTKKALSQAIGISVATLRGIEKHFSNVPDHSVLGPGVPTQEQFDAITYGEQLGGGSYGTVWRGRDSLGREIAVKFINMKHEGTAEVALAHATSLARTGGHPNIVVVHYCRRMTHPETRGQEVGIVMEFLDGVTLGKRLLQPMSRDIAVGLGLGIADALSFIHARGLLHGDLHADNVMVVNETAKVIDILNIKGLTALTSGHRRREVNADTEDLKGLLIQLLDHTGIDTKPLLLQANWTAASTAVAIRHIFEEYCRQPTAPAIVDRMQFLAKWLEVESQLRRLRGAEERHPQPLGVLASELAAQKLIPRHLWARIQALRVIRNKFVHGDPDIVKESEIIEVTGVASALAQLRGAVE